MCDVCISIYMYIWCVYKYIHVYVMCVSVYVHVMCVYIYTCIYDMCMSTCIWCMCKYMRELIEISSWRAACTHHITCMNMNTNSIRILLGLEECVCVHMHALECTRCVYVAYTCDVFPLEAVWSCVCVCVCLVIGTIFFANLTLLHAR